MRPVDPRLLRRVPATRRHLAGLGILGVLTGALVICQATALATALAAAAGGDLHPAALAAFAGTVALRALTGWAQAVTAARAAAEVKTALRADLLATVAGRGPAWLARQRTGELATLAGRGLDGLDAYFTGYLPQLVLTATVPLAVLARLTLADWTAAVTVALTLPLIPVFGALLGWQAQAATQRQWQRLSALGGHFLDMVAGLPTLRAFGRARAQTAVVRTMADQHRGATMGTLRIAFLSSLVLELVATLSVALVAVPVGLRLLDGGLSLTTALLVLLLAPEAYLPLRAAGTRYHASMEGLTALRETFSLLDGDADTRPDGSRQPAPTDPTADGPTARPPAPTTPTGDGPTARTSDRPRPDGDRPDGAAATTGRPGAAGTGSPRPDGSVRRPGDDDPVEPAPAEIRLDEVTVAYPRTVALDRVSLTIRAGDRLAVVGPSGAGKSTLLAVLLGFVVPTGGRVTVDGVDLADLDLDRWRRRLAWVPQRAHLFAASLADNIALGRPGADRAAIRAAVRAAALDDVVDRLPAGLDTVLGERGHGLSSGQRQRLALARAFLRDAGVLLLDEPTARLDGSAEAEVLAATQRLAAGRTAVLVAHRPALLRQADRVVRLDGGRLTELSARPGVLDPVGTP